MFVKFDIFDILFDIFDIIDKLFSSCMKPLVSRGQSRKVKSQFPSKKNSNASSIIYKQISTRMEQVYDRNYPVKTLKNERKVNEKLSLENITKKTSVINIPLVQPELRQKIMININKTVLKPQHLERKSFNYQYIIGKGGFGKVWRVQHLKNRNEYALKEMLKSLVMTKKSVQSVLNQRMLLADLNSPFLVNMHFAFQDRDTLYLVLDLMEGGDLRYHIGNKTFSEIQAKFFIGCIILGLQYLHSNKIIHRDIKPENLVLDSRGYIRVTDLGIARVLKQNNSTDTSGTPGYMSPQVICRQNHGCVSDFFGLGVIAYELMTGKRPYQGRSRNQIRDQMLAKQASLKLGDIPSDWSYQSIDFINKLIQRKPQNRLGFSGINQIKSHPWIKDLNWKKLASKQIESPFIPLMKKNNFDQDDQITIQDEQQAELIQKNSLLLRKPEFQQLFKNYYFDKVPKENEKTMKNNYLNENNISEREKQKQTDKISLKKNVETIRNSKESVLVKRSLQTIDTSYKETKKRSHVGGIQVFQDKEKEKSFFKDFRC